MDTSISWSIQPSYLFPKVRPLSSLLKRKQIPNRRFIRTHQFYKLQNQLCLPTLQAEIRQEQLQDYSYLRICNLPNIPHLMLRIWWLVYPSPATKRLVKPVWDDRAYLGQTHLGSVINTSTPILASRRGCTTTDRDKAISVNSTCQIRVESIKHHGMPHLIKVLPIHSQTRTAKAETQWGAGGDDEFPTITVTTTSSTIQQEVSA